MSIDYVKSNTTKKFYMLPQNINRPIVPKHVNSMVRSIEEFGLLMPIIVIEVDFLEGEKRRYIVDGQHRYNACLKLGIDFMIKTVGKGEDKGSRPLRTVQDVVELVAKLNNTSKKWSLEDYVNAWAKCPGTETSYLLLKKYAQDYNQRFTTVAMLANPANMHKAGRDLKEGKIKVVDRSLTETLLKNISNIFERLNKRDDRLKKPFISEMKVLIMGYTRFYMAKIAKREYNHEKFVNLLVQHKAHMNQYMHSPAVMAEFMDEVYKGGKLPRVMITQRAGSPKTYVGG